MEEQVQKMTGAGLKPTVMAQALEAIHGGVVNLRKVQSVRAALAGAERPLDGALNWILVDDFGGAKGRMETFAEGSAGGEAWQAFTGSSSDKDCPDDTLRLERKGPTVQDRNVLYADATKKLMEAASAVSDALPPADARMIS